MAPIRAPTSPAGTVSQPIGKPFNGQAKGLLWLTWRSYAGPPQYYIPPEGGALNPSGRRQPVPDRTLGAQGRQARRRHQPSPAGRQPSGIQLPADSFPKARSHHCRTQQKSINPAAKGGIKNGAESAHLASAAVLHTSRGRSPQPVREASAGPGQNPWRPGPSGPAAASTLARRASNLREYR